jgi:predicted MFS family arabinose efflux permease
MLADRVSRKRLIVFSVAAWSIVCAATGMAQSYPQLLALRVALGIAECLYLPAAIALLAEHHTTATRATAMSVHSVGLNLGVVAGGTAAGYLADTLGWRPGFLILGLIGIVLAGIAAIVLRDGPIAKAERPPSLPLLESLGRLVRIPSYLVLLSKAILAGIGVWIFLNWMPLYYRETFHMTLAGAGFAGTFLLQAMAILGIATGGIWSDALAKRSPRNRILLQSFAYLAAAPFLWLFLFNPGFTLVSVSVAMFSLIRGLGSAGESPVLCDVVEPRMRSTAIGIMNTGATTAGGLGVFVAGFLKQDFGLNGVFAGISIVFLIASALLMLCYFRWMQTDIDRAATNSPSPPA